MKKKYLFFSALLVLISFSGSFAQNCATLDITSTQDGSVCGEGSVTLSATSSGTGDDVVWYTSNAANDTIPVGFGSTFETPVLTAGQSYWASEVLYDTSSGASALLPELIYYKFDNSSTNIVNLASTPVGTSPTSVTGSSLSVGGSGLVNTALVGTGGSSSSNYVSTGWATDLSGSFTIGFWTSDVPVSSTLYYIFGDSGASGFRCFTNGVAGSGNWMVRGGGLPDLDVTGAATATGNYIHIVYDATSQTYTSYVDGVLNTQETGVPASTVTGSDLTIGGYSSNSGLDGNLDEFRWYNRALSLAEIQSSYQVSVDASIICESTREEVVATVNNLADEDVVLPLPYTHTANTSDYANNYSGAPGSGCSSDSYLNGDDVVYYYEPDNDMLVDIVLSGLGANDASIFIYDSCSDIGDACVAGEVNPGSSSSFGLEEYLVYDNQGFYIVISNLESSQSYNYTLTISESVVNCSNLTTPPSGTYNQYFDASAGDTFNDLNISGGNLTFYSDAQGATVVAGNTIPTDGSTYYVSQTLNGCESNLLEFLAVDFECSDLNVVSSQGDEVTCLGVMELQATAGGLGTDLYWYDAASGGDVVGIGSSFTTPELSSTTSYWVSEVFIDGVSDYANNAKVAPTGTSSYGYASNYGVVFDALQSFNIVSVEVYPDISSAMNMNVELWDSSGTVLNSTTVNVPAGNGTTPFVVPLGFNVQPGVDYRLVTPTDIDLIRDTSSGNNFPYDLGPGGVAGSVTSGAFSTTSTSTNYYYFYNWTISQGVVQCESAREEVVATVSTDGDESVLTLPYNDSNNDTANYGNPYAGEPGSNCGTTENYLAGNDVLYKYTATDTELVDILLSDLDGFYAGVFVYESCGDLGSNCVAGAVAGPDDSDFGIEDFQMTAGQDYYIVISSWLNPTVGYTLDIIPFDCAALGTPDGLAAQEFAPGDLLSDLDVEATETGAPLTWYSDAAGTTEIPDTTVLVDNTTYYVSQTYNNCESGLLAITVSEIDCSTLAITSTTGDTTSCRGELELSAVASGTGSEIYWYDAATGGSVVGVGEDFMTPELTQTTSYWASEVMLDGNGITSGWGRQDWVYNYGTTSYSGLAFEADEPFVLNTVDVFSSGNGGDLEVSLYDENETLIDSYTYVGVPAGDETNPVQVTLPLYFDIPAAGKYYLLKSSSVETKYDPSSSGHTYPMQLGAVGEITGYATSTFYEYTSSYYAFYNWTIAEGEFICESAREEAVATVNQSGDVTVDYTDLDYSDTNTTSLYGNNFSGDAGTSCDGVEALDGSDVVYQYVADPSNDDILTIELTGLTNTNSSLFIYDSCGEIGLNCLEGMMSDGSSSIVLDDYYVNAGESLFIVVSSTSGSTNYTLNITGFDCNNAASPEIDDASPYFVAGDMLDGIEVEGSAYATTYTWYSDAALTMVINDPTTETLVDGTTYYVTQTVLDCESTALAVTPEEFFCSDLEITSDASTTICTPGGNVILDAVGSGTGSEIYWYDAQTGGNVVNLGSTYETNVTQTTSYWVSEAFIQGEAPHTGNGKLAPTGSSSYGSTLNYGLLFDVDVPFTLQSVDVYPDESGTVEISLLDNSGSILQTATQSVSSSPSNPVTVQLNFNLTPGVDYRLLQTSNPSLDLIRDSSGNSFPYQIGPGGAYGTIQSGCYGTSYSGSGSYYYFFNWTVSTGDLICESPREEVVVTVNDVIPAAPTGASAQEYCEGATIGDLVANLSSTDSELIWYTDNANFTELSANTLLQDGVSYYASELLDACESANRLEVTVTILENSDLPTAATNQGFGTGEVLTDLDVQGDNLTWYYDQFGTQEVLDPTSEVLQDQETYYVSQTTAGNCESELLPITVHVSQLDTDNPLFSNMVYYPNPAKDYLILSNSTPIKSYEVYNLLGQKVMASSANANEVRVNTSNLSTGAYMVKVVVEDASAVFKIMKE